MITRAFKDELEYQRGTEGTEMEWKQCNADKVKCSVSGTFQSFI